jgi:hypothetical protein
MPIALEQDPGMDYYKKCFTITTELAKRYCEHCESEGLPVPAFAEEWWANQKKWEEERTNAMRASVLSKLTKEEAESIGLRLITNKQNANKTNINVHGVDLGSIDRSFTRWKADEY